MLIYKKRPQEEKNVGSERSFTRLWTVGVDGK